MVRRVRRVVTGHDAQGKSMFLMDGLAPNIKEMASMPGLALTDLWETRASPANNSGIADAAARPAMLEPPANGSILRIVEFPPDKLWRANADAMASFKSIGAGHAKDASNSDPMMHTTATIDYIIVLKGEIIGQKIGGQETGEKIGEEGSEESIKKGGEEIARELLPPRVLDIFSSDA